LKKINEQLSLIEEQWLGWAAEIESIESR
jgi:hypothetical protein